MTEYTPSPELQQKLQEFVKLDTEYKTAWDEFENRNLKILEAINDVREKRNALLDTVKRELRAEVEPLAVTDVPNGTVGPFRFVKKWSYFYSPNKFINRLKELNLYDMAIEAGVVKEKIEVAKFNDARDFLRKLGVLDKFEDCEDGEEFSVAISGPRSVPDFGSESSDSK